MDTTEKFCLRWNDFESNISGALKELREDKDFFDVTLACDDNQMEAHKVIISACSPFFRTILRRNKHEHPLLYLKGVKYADLVSVLNFMYHGEVNVAQEELNSFLAVAEDLKVKGLTQNSSETKSQNSNRPEAPRSQTLISNQRNEKPPQHIKHTRPVPLPSARQPPTIQPHDDDIQEVVPVKLEPVPIPQEPHTPVQQTYSAPQLDDQSTGVVADPNMEYGDEYGDYEAYDGADGGYGGGVFDNTGLVVQDGTKDFATTISEVLTYTADSQLWQCTVCGKSNSDKARIRRHAEVHFKGFIHACQHCGVEKKTSTALRIHIHTYHGNK